MADGPIMQSMRALRAEKERKVIENAGREIEKLKKLLRTACAMLQAYKHPDGWTPELESWWSALLREEQREAERQEKEKGERRQKLVEQARAKLTPEEFESLRESFSPHRGGGTSGV